MNSGPLSILDTESVKVASEAEIIAALAQTIRMKEMFDPNALKNVITSGEMSGALRRILELNS